MLGELHTQLNLLPLHQQSRAQQAQQHNTFEGGNTPRGCTDKEKKIQMNTEKERKP